jgi:hypothetical protein
VAEGALGFLTAIVLLELVAPVPRSKMFPENVSLLPP